ncbi:MAG: 1,2-phenylacetyl-CoA epoxidase subunit B [Bacillota bacterium]
MAEERLEYHIYEVFAQESQMAPAVHQFSLLASSPDMALILAKENFLRRQKAWSVWVVRRDHIHRTGPEEAEMFDRLDKSYRETEGYRYLKEKWRRYKHEPLTTQTMT